MNMSSLFFSLHNRFNEMKSEDKTSQNFEFKNVVAPKHELEPLKIY